jgi:SAM-dependent methyltransferase
MAIRRRASHALAYIRQHGLVGTARYAAQRIPEVYYEWCFGITTAGRIELEDLGVTNPFACHYYPTDYPSIFATFRRLPIRPLEDVFLDYGCGKGRVLVVAGTFPFRRVIGVELAAELSSIAVENLRRAHSKLTCRNVEVITGDAATYRVPADVTVIFFYNPFMGAALAGALEAIRASLEASPRRLRIIFKNPAFMASAMKDHPWLVKDTEFRARDANHTIIIVEADAGRIATAIPRPA